MSKGKDKNKDKKTRELRDRSKDRRQITADQ